MTERTYSIGAPTRTPSADLRASNAIHNSSGSSRTTQWNKEITIQDIQGGGLIDFISASARFESIGGTFNRRLVITVSFGVPRSNAGFTNRRNNDGFGLTLAGITAFRRTSFNRTLWRLRRTIYPTVGVGGGAISNPYIPFQISDNDAQKLADLANFYVRRFNATTSFTFEDGEVESGIFRGETELQAFLGTQPINIYAGDKQVI